MKMEDGDTKQPSIYFTMQVHMKNLPRANKVEYVFPMVISTESRMRQHRDDDHQEDAPHFNL